jgi:hypothetical protein
MKKILIYLLSSIVLVTLVIGLLPPVAAESKDSIVAESDYLIEPLHHLNTPKDTYYVTGSSVPGGSSVMKRDYQPLTTQAGEPLRFTISASDTDNTPLIYSASNLPPGANFDPQTRTFSWTPSFDQAGIYPNIHFQVSDGELTDSEDITITVINVDRPPVLDFVGNKLVNEEELIEFTISAADPDKDPLNCSASNLPPGATFGPQTRTFSWTPSFGQRGSYPGIHFEVSDGELIDFEDITITVAMLEENAFSVNDLRINPNRVGVGKKVNIRVFATNGGTNAGSYEVALQINGIIEDNKILTLAAGTTEEVKFMTTKDAAGTYVVDVNGLTGSFEVRSEGNKGRKQKPNSKDFLYQFVGWIRTIVQERSDA